MKRSNRLMDGLVGLCIIAVLVLCIIGFFQFRLWRGRVAAARIGDVDVATKTLGELTSELRETPELSQKREGGINVSTVYVDWWIATWDVGVSVEFFPSVRPSATNHPTVVTISKGFMGSYRGVHLGETCSVAAKKLGLPPRNLSENHSEQEQKVGYFSWRENKQHQLVMLTAGSGDFYGLH